MSWRPGEVWLDTDALWRRAGEAAPVAAGIDGAWLRLPEPGPPPGLFASRARRTAWEQRRDARRARAAAVAVSPALLVSLLALRGERVPSLPLLRDDPPSATYRIGTVAAPVAGERTAIAVDSAAADPGPARPSASTATRRVTGEATPAIAWRRATSIGLPHSGRLVDGTQLPVRGPDWVTWSPVRDSVPNVPDRLYGTEGTIRAILAVTHAYRLANPGAPPVLVGDVSRRGGGPMTDEHVSHQNGRDVDVYLPRVDGTLRAPRAPEQIDRRLAQDLLDRFVAAGAEVIFVGHSTGLHGRAGTVVPYAGHENHMHVRFPPSGG